jgi:hypothetical protein
VAWLWNNVATDISAPSLTGFYLSWKNLPRYVFYSFRFIAASPETESLDKHIRNPESGNSSDLAD